MQTLYRALCVGTIASVLLSSWTPKASASSRYVLNQTPQTIERYFGRYWTRLTQTGADGTTRVTYTYSPRRIQRVFPQTRVSRFAIAFVNNRSQSLSLAIEGNPDTQSFTYEQPQAARFFEFVFGYRPAIWQELSSQFTGNETIYDYQYCLGDGVATGFTLGGARQFLLSDATLYYNVRCEPPYRSQ